MKRTRATAVERRAVDNFRRHRDPRSFQRLYESHGESVWRFALRLSGDTAIAEEIAQESWVRAISRIETFSGRSTLRTWLLGFVLNAHREHSRHQSRDRLRLVPAGELPGAEQSITASPWNRIDLERALASLAPGYREILLLHDVEGLTHAEVAELLEIEAGTSKSQLSRARASLRQELSEGMRHEPSQPS